MSNNDESSQPVTLPIIMAYLQQSMAQQQTAIADLQAQIETINSHQQTEHQGLANNPHPEPDIGNSPNSLAQDIGGPNSLSPTIDTTGLQGSLKLPNRIAFQVAFRVISTIGYSQWIIYFLAILSCLNHSK